MDKAGMLEAKKKMEKDILQLVDDFEKSTGLTIVTLRLIHEHAMANRTTARTIDVEAEAALMT